MVVQAGPRKSTPFQETKGVVTIERGMLKQQLAAMAHLGTSLNTRNGIDQVQDVRFHIALRRDLLLRLEEGPNAQVKRFGPAFAVTRLRGRLQSLPFLAIKAVRSKRHFCAKKEGFHTSLVLGTRDHREEDALSQETKGRSRHLGGKGIRDLKGCHGQGDILKIRQVGLPELLELVSILHSHTGRHLEVSEA